MTGNVQNLVSVSNGSSKGKSIHSTLFASVVDNLKCDVKLSCPKTLFAQTKSILGHAFDQEKKSQETSFKLKH